MVLGCSVCNQPLVIRPNNVGYQDPNALMKTFRPRKITDNNDNSDIKANVDLTDAEIVATRCGHMFHKECLKNYLQGSLKKLTTKHHGCPMCRKPVIQSQLWPIIIRATKEELKQIEKIKDLKNKNAELVTAIKEIRNNTHEKNSALQNARKKMFDYRVKLQGMDVQSVSKGNLEKLEKKQGDLERELAAVNEQNLALTSLVERESVYGQKIRSEQNKTDITNDADVLTTMVKQITSTRIRKEGLVEKSAKCALEPSTNVTNENPPIIVKDALERWRQMKMSLGQNEDNGDHRSLPHTEVKRQDLTFNFLRDNSKRHMQKSLSRNPHNTQYWGAHTRSRSQTPSTSADPYITDKITTTGLGSDLLKLENRARNRYKPM